MINKKKWIDFGSQLTTIASHYNNEALATEVETTNRAVSHYEIKVLFVGHFSAGKSALLNGILKRPNFLIENQSPQTAVATELHYSTTEKVIIHNNNGEIIEKESSYAVPVEDVDYIDYRLNSDALKEIGDFTLVDTPGFDSGIEKHNHALSSYLGNGSFYVLVINIEKGVVDSQTIQFIQELSVYNDELIILLNKRDKITTENAEAVMDSVQCTLDMEGIHAKVFCVSKFDEDLSKKICGAISELDIQAAFDRHAQNMYNRLIIEMKEILDQQLRDYEDISTFDYDKRIKELNRACEELKRLFELEKKKAEDALPSRIDELKGKIRVALEGCADAVVSASNSGGSQAAEAVIVETLRPLLLQYVRSYSEQNMDSIIQSMNQTMNQLESKDSQINKLMKSAAENTKKLIEDGMFDKISSLCETDDNKSSKKNKKGDNTAWYHAVSGALAILTDVIAPWMEIIIILAPDIISLAKTIFGESDYERAKRIYLEGTVPQIVCQLHDPAVEAMKESNKQLIALLQTQLAEKTAIVKASIAETQEKKKKDIETNTSYRNNLKNDLQALANMESTICTGGSTWH